MPYALTIERPGLPTLETLNGLQVRTRPVQVMLYGFPRTAAGRQSLSIVMAHLRRRAREIDRHPGLWVIPGATTVGTDEPLFDDPDGNTIYGSIRVLIQYQSS
ncbi:hypothetical protein Deipe_1532 [Deinococcus peraridilitoris DSM 19664]|uniref:Tail terminator n=2 Tax=Deinococcus TaxID=1298 RepID=K9ZZK2_DEIPD|nr:hypothetical protein Deipe_1532 [Deinococcus peraridilitoris DSM 19664]